MAVAEALVAADVVVDVLGFTVTEEQPESQKPERTPKDDDEQVEKLRVATTDVDAL